jgi:hypothetical protein
VAPGAISDSGRFNIAGKETMELEMDEEIARVRVHHIESFRRLAMTLENLANDANGLLRQWEAELNPADEEATKQFEPPVTEPRR